MSKFKVKTTLNLKEYFLESFVELTPGYYTGMCFGRTEAKTNSFYFSCLTAREEKARHPFEFIQNPDNFHNFFDLIDSVVNHIKKVGFIIDDKKLDYRCLLKRLKKLTLSINKEINMDTVFISELLVLEKLMLLLCTSSILF